MCIQCANGFVLNNQRTSCEAIVANTKPLTANTVANCVNYVVKYEASSWIHVCAECELDYVL